MFPISRQEGASKYQSNVINDQFTAIVVLCFFLAENFTSPSNFHLPPSEVDWMVTPLYTERTILGSTEIAKLPLNHLAFNCGIYMLVFLNSE